MTFIFKKPPNDIKDMSQIPNNRGYQYVKSIVKNFTFALDIGAHVGTMARKMAKDFQNIECFEPYFFEYLMENTKDLDNVLIHSHGLGNENSTAKLYVMESNTGGSSLVKHPKRTWQKQASTITTDVLIKRLDDFEFNTIDFIKIDVESFEYFVIDGARETLQQHSPAIMIEYLKKYQHPTHTSAMTHKILTSLGYKQVKQFQQDFFYIKG